jgi:hypothetical protein
MAFLNLPEPPRDFGVPRRLDDVVDLPVEAVSRTLREPPLGRVAASARHS